MKSAVWAGANGFNLLSSSVIFPPDKDQEPDFAKVQQAQIRAYREPPTRPEILPGRRRA